MERAISRVSRVRSRAPHARFYTNFMISQTGNPAGKITNMFLFLLIADHDHAVAGTFALPRRRAFGDRARAIAAFNAEDTSGRVSGSIRRTGV